jgi:hypothetical protein
MLIVARLIVLRLAKNRDAKRHEKNRDASIHENTVSKYRFLAQFYIVSLI